MLEIFVEEKTESSINVKKNTPVFVTARACADWKVMLLQLTPLSVKNCNYCYLLYKDDCPTSFLLFTWLCCAFLTVLSPPFEILAGLVFFLKRSQFISEYLNPIMSLLLGPCIFCHQEEAKLNIGKE